MFRNEERIIEEETCVHFHFTFHCILIRLFTFQLVLSISALIQYNLSISSLLFSVYQFISMAFPYYYPVVPSPCVNNPVLSSNNVADGYKWYQSCPSWDVMAASPCLCGCQSSIPQTQVGTPNPYYTHEYEPPPVPLSCTYTSQGSNSKLLDENRKYSDCTLRPCHVHASPEISNHTWHYQTINPSSYPSSFTCTDTPPVYMYSPTYQQFISPLTPQIDTSTMVQVPTTNVTSSSSNIVDAKLFDKSAERKITYVDNIVNVGGFNNPVDDSLVLKIFAKSQNSSSIVEYVEMFMDNISKVEIAFGRKFKDDLLCYHFVIGLKEEIRDALDMWSPKTLQEAINLAKFQESLLGQKLIVKEALDEVNVVQDDSTKSLMNEKQGDVQEEIVDALGEESKQLDESSFVADSEVITDEDNKVPGYPMDSENFHEQTNPNEVAPESGMEVEEDDAQEIVVDELKVKSEQYFDTFDESHFIHEVNANSVMVEDEDCEVEKPLRGCDNPHEHLDLGAGEESETNKNIESVVSTGADSYMTYSDESKDDILDNNDPKENADQTEDEMDSEKSFLDEVEPSIPDILNNDYPKEIATGAEISSVAPFLSSGGAENKPVTKTPSVKGNSVSDDKENINGNGMMFVPTAEEAKKNKKNELNEKSLRELTKLLREKLQISNNTAEEIGKVTKERPALQKLEVNCQR